MAEMRKNEMSLPSLLKCGFMSVVVVRLISITVPEAKKAKGNRWLVSERYTPTTRSRLTVNIRQGSLQAPPKPDRSL